MTDMVKDMQIAGCRVHLTFQALDGGRWNVHADVQCGIGSETRRQTVHSGPCRSRETAEQKALDQVCQILGHNDDRNTFAMSS